MGGVYLNRISCYLLFRGFYAVNAAAGVLSRFNITNRIVKAPVAIEGSCSFAVLVRSCDLRKSVDILQKEGINAEKAVYSDRSV